METDQKIVFDEESHPYLSNFYQATFVENGYTYKTVEHYFQSEKAPDTESKEMIINAETPELSKTMGRNLSINFEP